MDNLEKKFKEGLKNHQVTTSDKVWENISQSLNYKRKIKRFFLWFFVLGLFGVALLLGYRYIYKSNQKEKQRENHSTILAEKSKADLNKTILKNSNKSESLSRSKSVVSVNKEKESAEINTSLLNSAFNSTSINNTNNNLVINSPSNPLPVSINSEDRKIKYYKREVFAINKASGIGLTLLSNNPINSLKILSHPQSGTLNDCFPTKHNKWFFEIYLSPDYFLKSLTGPKPEYINSRLDTESPLVSFSGGIQMGYKFDKGILLRSGFNYSRINERFHFVKKDVKNTQTVITIDTVWAGDGSYTISRDTTINEIYGTEDIQKLIAYSMIDIPVILGYEIKYSDFKIGLNAGIILNILTTNKGAMLNMDGEVETFDSKYKKNSIFNKNLGASLFASVDASFRVNDRIDVFIEPRFRLYLKSFTTSNYPLIQKYTNFGISFGPRFYFN